MQMAVQRIQIANNKRINAVKIQKKKIADLLAENKYEKAQIQVEHIIRDDFTIEGYEVLELMCELVHERVRQITTSTTTVPVEMMEAVGSLIWAAKHVEIDELKNVRQQLKQKFGSEFIKIAEANEDGKKVNVRLINKMVYRPPSRGLVRKYLEEIAKAYNVDWTPPPLIEAEDVFMETPFATPVGDSIPMAPGSGFASAYAPTLINATPNTVLTTLFFVIAILNIYSVSLPSQRFPTLTEDEERELEAAKRLQQSASLARPAPEAVSPPAPAPSTQCK